MDPTALERHITAQIELKLADFSIAAVRQKKAIQMRLLDAKSDLAAAKRLLEVETSKHAMFRSILLSEHTE